VAFFASYEERIDGSDESEVDEREDGSQTEK
jgi:hypothetical protein